MARNASIAAVAMALLAGCAKAPVRKDYAKLVAADPRSILIVPVVNNSVNVDAPAYLLSTLPIPVAERGYYVFPVNLVKRLLEDEGLSDASLVHLADPMRLCNLFGADAVLLVSIERWDAQYIVISTQVTVALEYVLKDGKTGETLWTEKQSVIYSSDSGAGGGGLGSLLAALVSAAVTKASPDYMPLARQANAGAMAFPGPGFPAGPYLPSYKKDRPAERSRTE
jgi:hypothetical protein